MWFEYPGDSLVFRHGGRGAVYAHFAGAGHEYSVGTLRMEYSDDDRESGDDAGVSDALRGAGWM